LCESLAWLVCMKTSTPTSCSSSSNRDAPDIKVGSHDATVTTNDTKQLDVATLSPPSSAAVAAVSAVERLLASISDLLETRLRSDSQRRHEADKHQQMMNEWMIAAAVIDRVCFVVFSITLVIVSVVFYLLVLFYS